MALLGRKPQGYAMPPLEWRKVCVLFITAMMLKIVLDSTIFFEKCRN